MKKRIKIIAINIIVVLVIIVVSIIFKQNDRYHDFKKECTGDIYLCNDVPLCLKGDTVAIPDVGYGEEVNLGSYGGYFWNNRTPEEDINEIEDHMIDYFDQLEQRREQYYKSIAECIKSINNHP